MGSLYNPDYLLSLCRKHGLSPSKKYGQNYLLDEEVIDAMIQAGEVTQQDTVVEVGPGFGILTIPLARAAGRVFSFEIEKKLEAYWSALIEKEVLSNLFLIWGNVLKSFTQAGVPSPYKVIANLPYQITSMVIREFLETPQPPERMVLMVQKEVAQRICAKPGDMSVLALAVQYYATATLVRLVPRESFWPSPQVDSAVIKLVRKADIPDQEFTRKFFKLVKTGFAQRRKLLFKNLLPLFGKEHKYMLEQTFVQNNLSLEARAQELSLEQWKTIVLSTYALL